MKKTKPQEPKIHCAYDKLVAAKTLKEHPKNPNKHPDAQIELLAKIIANQGWRSPVVVSKRSGFIVAGHARLLAAKRLGVGMVPVNYQAFPDEAHELAHLVADNKIAELAEMDQGELAALLRELDGRIDIDLTGFNRDELEVLLSSDKDDKTYSSKIVVPVYEPKGDQPKISELLDHKKTDELLAGINAAKLPADIATFLRLAAERHTVFNFAGIAEYYCHADKTVQNLMEKSGLVIVDFDKAIENGFVCLTDRLGALADKGDFHAE